MMLTLLYSPFPTLEAARAAATSLLEARVVACCNLLPIAESLYWWEGKLAANPEVALLAKTTHERAPEAARMLEALHPYDTPAILRYEAASNEAFAAWAQAQCEQNLRD